MMHPDDWARFSATVLATLIAGLITVAARAAVILFRSL